MANAYISQVPFRIGDKEYTLQIDYQAIGSYQSLFPDADWTGGIVDAFDRSDMELVSKVILIALERNHKSEITYEEIFAESPPYKVAFKAMEAAMCCSLFGAPDALKGLDLEEPEKDEAEGASGTAPLTPRARWRARGNWLTQWVFRAQSSGA